MPIMSFLSDRLVPPHRSDPEAQSFGQKMWWQRRPNTVALMLLAPVLIWLALFFLYPLGRVLSQSLLDPGLTSAHYARLFSNATYLSIIGQTIVISLVVAALAVIAGYPVAAWLAQKRGRALSLGFACVLLPLWTSALVRNYAWIIILRAGGTLDELFIWMGLTLNPLLYTSTAVVLGMVYTLLPYAILTLYNGLRDIDGSYMRAAGNLGAPPLARFLRIYLPLSKPCILAAFLLVFILSVGFYITPALLGGGQVQMIAPQIDNQMNTLVNWGFGSALAIVLFLIVSATVVICVGVFGINLMGLSRKKARARTVAITSKSLLDDSGPVVSRPALIRDHNKPQVGTYGQPRAAVGGTLLMGYSCLMFVFLIFPVLVIVGTSFTTTNFLKFPPQGFTLDWYAKYFQDASWVSATLLSIFVATCSALIATLLATLAAIGMVRSTSFNGKNAIYLLLLAPLIVPVVVIAVGSYFLFADLKLLGSAWTFIIAYVVIDVPIAFLIIIAAMQKVDLSLERAAMVMGANPVQAFMRSTFPVIWPALLAATLFSFIHAFDDVVIAEFVSTVTKVTLPKKIWVSLVYSIEPTISAISTLLVIFSSCILSVILLAGKKRNPMSSS